MDTFQGEGKAKKTKKAIRFLINKEEDGSYSVKIKNKKIKFPKKTSLNEIKQSLKSLVKVKRRRGRVPKSDFFKTDYARTIEVNPNIISKPYPGFEQEKEQKETLRHLIKVNPNYAFLPGINAGVFDQSYYNRFNQMINPKPVYQRKTAIEYPEQTSTLNEGVYPQKATKSFMMPKSYFIEAKKEHGNKNQKILDSIISNKIKEYNLKEVPTKRSLTNLTGTTDELKQIAALDALNAAKQNSLAESKSEEDLLNEMSEELKSLRHPSRTTQAITNTIVSPATPFPSQALARGEVIGSAMNKNGLSNFEIDKVMDKYPDYLGTISHDEIQSKILPLVREKSRGSFIINTDPKSKSGEHWQAMFFDARPQGSHSIEWFDSYGDSIDPKLLRDVKLIADKLNADTYLKFKENRIKYQGDSVNCGPFCIRFLVDRFRGKPFKEATGYDKRGEKDIEKFKFQYMPSFSEEQSGGNILTGTYLNYYPRSMRKFLTSPIGNENILSLRVGRVPLTKATSTVLNLVTFGGWDKAKAKLGYDNVFHLYLVINDKYRLERNHITTMYGYSKPSDEQSVIVPLSQEITISELLNKTAAQVGPGLQRYSGSSNNCQDFVIQVLSANNLLTENLRTFIKQDIESIYEHLPFYAKWVSNLVTDTAHKIEKTREDVTSLAT